MPQFDFYSFALQNFYVLLAFFSLHFFLLYFYLPRYAETLKMRKKLLKLYGAENSAKKTELLDLFLKHIFSRKI